MGKSKSPDIWIIRKILVVGGINTISCLNKYKGIVCSVQAMKVRRGKSGIAPLIIYLGTRRR